MKATIITVCKNAQESIEQTIRSVCSQTYQNIEYIVVDGKSSDRTLALCKKYQSCIDMLLSEKDKGIFDAMNKGIGKATGDIIYFLNAGDTFVRSDVVSEIVKTFQMTRADIVYGNTVVLDAKGYISFYKKHNNVNRYFFHKDTINHQAIFAKRFLFFIHGGFDTRYGFIADLEWELRMFLNPLIKKIYKDMAIVFYPLGGKSDIETKHTSTQKKLIEQRRRLISSRISWFYLCAFWIIDVFNFFFRVLKDKGL